MLKKNWNKPEFYFLATNNVKGGALAGTHENSATSQGHVITIGGAAGPDFKIHKSPTSPNPASYNTRANPLASYNS